MAVPYSQQVIALDSFLFPAVNPEAAYCNVPLLALAQAILSGACTVPDVEARSGLALLVPGLEGHSLHVRRPSHVPDGAWLCLCWDGGNFLVRVEEHPMFLDLWDWEYMRGGSEQHPVTGFRPRIARVALWQCSCPTFDARVPDNEVSPHVLVPQYTAPQDATRLVVWIEYQPQCVMAVTIASSGFLTDHVLLVNAEGLCRRVEALSAPSCWEQQPPLLQDTEKMLKTTLLPVSWSLTSPGTLRILVNRSAGFPHRSLGFYRQVHAPASEPPIEVAHCHGVYSAVMVSSRSPQPDFFPFPSWIPHKYIACPPPASMVRPVEAAASGASPARPPKRPLGEVAAVTNFSSFCRRRVSLGKCVPSHVAVKRAYFQERQGSIAENDDSSEVSDDEGVEDCVDDGGVRDDVNRIDHIDRTDCTDRTEHKQNVVAEHGDDNHGDQSPMDGVDDQAEAQAVCAGKESEEEDPDSDFDPNCDESPRARHWRRRRSKRRGAGPASAASNDVNMVMADPEESLEHAKHCGDHAEGRRMAVAAADTVPAASWCQLRPDLQNLVSSALAKQVSVQAASHFDVKAYGYMQMFGDASEEDARVYSQACQRQDKTSNAASPSTDTVVSPSTDTAALSTHNRSPSPRVSEMAQILPIPNDDNDVDGGITNDADDADDADDAVADAGTSNLMQSELPGDLELVPRLRTSSRKIWNSGNSLSSMLNSGHRRPSFSSLLAPSMPENETHHEPGSGSTMDVAEGNFLGLSFDHDVADTVAFGPDFFPALEQYAVGLSHSRQHDNEETSGSIADFQSQVVAHAQQSFADAEEMEIVEAILEIAEDPAGTSAPLFPPSRPRPTCPPGLRRQKAAPQLEDKESVSV